MPCDVSPNDRRRHVSSRGPDIRIRLAQTGGDERIATRRRVTKGY